MLPLGLRILYLHGFASSPASRKATFFTNKFQPLGLDFRVPELVPGPFEKLTLSSQLEVIDAAAEGADSLLLIGSSLGGYLAGLYAARNPAVSGLILLAPAFNFHQLWTTQLGAERLSFWRENGTIPVFHYGEGRNLLVGFQLLEDAARYEPVPAFVQPALIFHGNQDSVVPVQYSEDCAKTHPNVRLVRVESGHELTDALDVIWEETRPFVLCRL